MRAGVGYKREPWESRKSGENIVELVMRKSAREYYLDEAGYSGAENLDMNRAWLNESGKLILDHKVTEMLQLQWQTDTPHMCIAFNVESAQQVCITDCPTLESIGILEDRDDDQRDIILPGADIDDIFNLHNLSADKILLYVMSEDTSECLAPGGKWDDMNYDKLREIPQGLFDAFIRNLTSFVCDLRPDSPKYFTDNFPTVYLNKYVSNKYYHRYLLN